MNAEKIIYDKLKIVWLNRHYVGVNDLERLARNAVEEIREEFKKAGVDVWPRESDGET